MKKYVLDSSALLTLYHNESGSDHVEKILRDHHKEKNLIFVSFISFTEVYYIIYRLSGKGEAYKTYLQLKMLPIDKVNPTEELLMKAGEIKATYSMSLADSYIAATAMDKDSILIHKDPEFEVLSDAIKMMILPYK